VTAQDLTLFAAPTKPPYTVPRLADYRTPHGLIAVSTFSGGGGSSLGLKQAGWTIPYSSEFIPAARETYQANFPDTFVDPRDIRELTADDILHRLGIDVGELDLFEGSPPCSSFSTANRSGGAASRFGTGKVKPYSDGVKQATDDLFDEWLRVLEGLRPRAVLAENVPALTHEGEAAAFFDSIIRRLSALGYEMRSGVFYAHHYGAATKRARLFMYGVRRDVSQGWHDRPDRDDHVYTLRDALDTMPADNPADEITLATPDPEHKVGKVWAGLKHGESPDGTGFSLVRCAWDKPVPTITATAGMSPTSYGVMHPDVCRKFTATEAAWISGFPPDYINIGNPGQRFERIGRAVPPPMYRAMGDLLARALGAT
jgi:DNA (cytosine-5)-methyltransferase 1